MSESAKEVYWGVKCHQCGDLIGLAKVRYDQASGKVLPPTVKATNFKADCPQGHSRDFYSVSEVIEFQGPAVLAFPTHPDFR
jgi:hypothetical protein